MSIFFLVLQRKDLTFTFSQMEIPTTYHSFILSLYLHILLAAVCVYSESSKILENQYLKQK